MSEDPERSRLCPPELKLRCPWGAWSACWCFLGVPQVGKAGVCKVGQRPRPLSSSHLCSCHPVSAPAVSTRGSWAVGYVMWLVAPRDNLSLEAQQDIKASVRGQACPWAVAAHAFLLPGILGSSWPRWRPSGQVKIALAIIHL